MGSSLGRFRTRELGVTSSPAEPSGASCLAGPQLVLSHSALAWGWVAPDAPPLSPPQREERTMLEDLWVTLSELDTVSFSFKQLDENYVASE